MLLQSYLANKNRSASYEHWLLSQTTFPSIATLASLAIPSSTTLTSLHLHNVHSFLPSRFSPLFFSCFLHGLETPAIRIQSSFYSAIERLLQSQASLFLRPSILSLIQQGVQSPYISVREKNLKLLLSASSILPSLLLFYATVIRQSTLDRGVSVRKAGGRLVVRLMSHVWAKRETLGKEAIIRVFGWVSERVLAEEEKSIRKICEESVLEVVFQKDEWILVGECCELLSQQALLFREEQVDRLFRELNEILMQPSHYSEYRQRVQDLFDTNFDESQQVDVLNEYYIGCFITYHCFVESNLSEITRSVHDCLLLYT